METVVVKGRDSDSRIVCGDGAANLARYLPENARTVVVTDENVVRCLPEAARKYPRIVIGTKTSGWGPKVVPENPRGATPTTVSGYPLTMIV